MVGQAKALGPNVIDLVEILNTLVKEGIINEDDRELASFILEYLSTGKWIISNESRRGWYENLVRNGCVDGRGRLIATGDVDETQLSLWMLCATGAIKFEARDEAAKAGQENKVHTG